MEWTSEYHQKPNSLEQQVAVDGTNPANQLIGGLIPVFFKVSYIPGGWPWDWQNFMKLDPLPGPKDTPLKKNPP